MNEQERDALIRDRIEAKRAIGDWTSYYERIDGLLKAETPLGTSLVGEAGVIGWEHRRGQIDYKAAFEALSQMVKEWLDDHSDEMPEAESFRKPSSYSWYVRPHLREAPERSLEAVAE